MSKQTDLINIPDVITVSGAVVTESASASTVEHTINNETSSGNRYSMITFKDQGTNKYYQYQNHNDGHVLIRNEHATGSLQFMTGGANERIRIDSDGLKFHGDTAAANALNDYEEGTFTPVVEFGGGNTGITYNARSGFYTKIGNVVYFYAECQLSARGTSTGNLAIRDLPFSPQRTATSTSVLTGNLSSTSDIQIFISTNGKINFENRNTGTQSSLTHNNVNSTSTFFVSGTYQTAS